MSSYSAGLFSSDSAISFAINQSDILISAGIESLLSLRNFLKSDMLTTPLRWFGLFLIKSGIGFVPLSSVRSNSLIYFSRKSAPFSFIKSKSSCLTLGNFPFALSRLCLSSGLEDTEFTSPYFLLVSGGTLNSSLSGVVAQIPLSGALPTAAPCFPIKDRPKSLKCGILFISCNLFAIVDWYSLISPITRYFNKVMAALRPR